MSLRKKTEEIKRLVSAFEREADKFHEISFSTFYITDKDTTLSRKFISPNHTIMLWQYYGKIEPQAGVKKLAQNLKDSDGFVAQIRPDAA